MTPKITQAHRDFARKMWAGGPPEIMASSNPSVHIEWLAEELAETFPAPPSDEKKPISQTTITLAPTIFKPGTAVDPSPAPSAGEATRFLETKVKVRSSEAEEFLDGLKITLWMDRFPGDLMKERAFSKYLVGVIEEALKQLPSATLTAYKCREAIAEYERTRS